MFPGRFLGSAIGGILSTFSTKLPARIAREIIEATLLRTIPTGVQRRYSLQISTEALEEFREKPLKKFLILGGTHEEISGEIALGDGVGIREGIIGARMKAEESLERLRGHPRWNSAENT